MRCPKRALWGQTQEILVLVDDVTLAVLDPSKVGLDVGNIAERVIVVGDHSLYFLVNAFSQCLRMLLACVVGRGPGIVGCSILAA